MNHPAAARTTRRTLGPTVVNLVIVTATIIGALLYQSASSSASSVGEPAPPQRPLPPSASSAPPISDGPRAGGGRTTEGGGAVTEDDGALPDGVTVVDDGYPGVANLDPGLRRALLDAATAAAGDGIELHVNSGWRSGAYQEQLFREAVARYGSKREAARWVATPDTSAHVSGDAVDIGPFDAAAWLSDHGARYGLCQTYRNESWHYELRPAAADRGCPPMHADSAHDPDLQR